MTTFKNLLESIEASPEGPQIAAIFDFDGTLIAGYSATSFIREQLRRGDLSAPEVLKLARAMVNFGFGTMGFSAMMLVNAQFMRGVEEEEYRQLGRDLFNKKIAQLVYPESRALLEAHKKKGHTIAIISSATDYQLDAAAEDLGIEHVLCSHLEVKDGRFTGGVVRPTCFGWGKVTAAEQLADKTGADLAQSFFYSDSMDDIQLLTHVGHPVALNPSDSLGRYARRKQWPVGRFGSRGRPSIARVLRSAAATISMVPAFLAGLPIYALTGSRREALNFSFSLFADTASALVDVSINTRGEHHLWSHRPAVFIFNHQSKADVFILAKLLRRDITGIGKKEIRNMPLIGQVMAAGGMVFIDRANSTNAIEAMKPLVEAINVERKSVVIAPEGTRTVSPRLGPFKKGAFHLAMQAGVPLVPIVVHNAGDVAPKGGFVFNPATVEVTVLPPIDTSSWDTATIDIHVQDVRDQFLQTLDQRKSEAESGDVENSADTRSKTTKEKKARKSVRSKAKKPNEPKPSKPNV